MTPADVDLIFLTFFIFGSCVLILCTHVSDKLLCSCVRVWHWRPAVWCIWVCVAALWQQWAVNRFLPVGGAIISSLGPVGGKAFFLTRERKRQIFLLLLSSRSKNSRTEQAREKSKDTSERSREQCSRTFSPITTYLPSTVSLNSFLGRQRAQLLQSCTINVIIENVQKLESGSAFKYRQW